MSFLHLHARSLWQIIKQSIRQWVKPDNYSPALNAALDLSRSKSELINVLKIPRMVQKPRLAEIAAQPTQAWTQMRYLHHTGGEKRWIWRLSHEPCSTFVWRCGVCPRNLDAYCSKHNGYQ
jgi:hypothetical protein